MHSYYTVPSFPVHVGPDYFPILLKIHIPPLCCQGSVQAVPLFSWYQWSLTVGDRHRLARLSAPLCAHVLTCHSAEPFEVSVQMQKCCGHLRTLEKQVKIVVEIAPKLNWGWHCCCHSDREIKPPVSEGLNWVPALNTRRWMDDHREGHWKRSLWQHRPFRTKLR